MPTKTQTAKLSSQASLVASPPTPPAHARQPLPLASPPTIESITPLKASSSRPKSIFPEWLSANELANENWCTMEEPFCDSQSTFPQIPSDGVVWKRPSEYLPLILDISPSTDSIREVKTTNKKMGKKAEPDTLHPPGPKHAHIVYFGNSSNSKLNIPLTGLIPRDFRRQWSAEQRASLVNFDEEELRVEQETQRVERQNMGFEEKVSNVLNNRPVVVSAFEDIDITPEDFIDDENDDDTMDLTDPLSIYRPPVVHIAPNLTERPSEPQGEVVDSKFATYFRMVETLHAQLKDKDEIPCLWQTIYPQDESKIPVYNIGGKYLVKLYLLGKWRKIEVDDRIPLNQRDECIILGSSMRNELWPTLLVKALLKVETWMKTRPVTEEERMHLMITCLTGWHITTFPLQKNETLQQLQPYLPSQQEDSIQDNIEEGRNADNDPGAIHHARVFVLCTNIHGAHKFAYGECGLLANADDTRDQVCAERDLAQEEIPRSSIDQSDFQLFLAHPPSRHACILMQLWPQSANEVDDKTMSETVPYFNPKTQYLVLHLKNEQQETYDRDEQGDISIHLRLSRVPHANTASSDSQDELNIELMKALGLDLNGSLVLMQQPLCQRLATPSHTAPAQVPLIVKLDTKSSRTITIAKEDFINRDRNVKDGEVAFQVIVQPSVQYGFTLEVESDHVTPAFQTVSALWRNAPDAHIVEKEGEYPALAKSTYTILFKHSIQLQRPNTEDDLFLQVDLQLSDHALGKYTTIRLINDATSIFQTLPLLQNNRIKLQDVSTSDESSVSYTIVCEVNTPTQDVSPGQWYLTVCSAQCSVVSSASQRIEHTCFCGRYTANKPLLLFRDVLSTPASSIWTSFRLQLNYLEESGERSRSVAPGIFVILEILDLETNAVIASLSNMNQVFMLQLPPLADPAKSKYIVQARLDATKCNLSDELRSIRPFRNRLNTATEETTSPPEPIEIISKGDAITTDQEESTNVIEQGCMSARPETNLEWTLSCWSVETVQLALDRRQEEVFEKMQAEWISASVNRATNGQLSRMMYLGRSDEDIAACAKELGIDESMVATMKSRYADTNSDYQQDVKIISEDVLRHVTQSEVDEETWMHREELSASHVRLDNLQQARESLNAEMQQELQDIIGKVEKSRGEYLDQVALATH